MLNKVFCCFFFLLFWGFWSNGLFFFVQFRLITFFLRWMVASRNQSIRAVGCRTLLPPPRLENRKKQQLNKVTERLRITWYDPSIRCTAWYLLPHHGVRWIYSNNYRKYVYADVLGEKSEQVSHTKYRHGRGETPESWLCISPTCSVRFELSQLSWPSTFSSRNGLSLVSRVSRLDSGWLEDPFLASSSISGFTSHWLMRILALCS